MKNVMQKIILTVAMTLSSLGFAGQHSGLGGGAPPAPKPVPEPSWYETLEQYYEAYYLWLREQMELGLQGTSEVQETK